MKSTWLLNGIWVTQDPNRTVFKGHVKIQDNRFSEIQKKKPSDQQLKNSKVIDLTGFTVIPGFIQTHVHLCQTLFRNMADDLELLDWLKLKIWKFEAAHTPETITTSAELGIYDLLRSGTTTLLDMGTVKHTESLIKTAIRTGVRASLGKCLMDHPETTPTNLRESTQNALNEAVQLHKKYHGTQNDRIRISYAPRFAISCTDKLLKTVAKLAHDGNTLVHTHSSENQKEIELVKKMSGLSNIEYLNSLGLTGNNVVLAHCVWPNPKEIQILKSTHTHVAHCPSSNLKLASGIAPILGFLKQDINVSLGVDGAPCNNRFSMFEEMRLAGLIQKPVHGPTALPAHQILDMATINGAKALQWDGDIGSIEVGKKADFCVLDLKHPGASVPLNSELDFESIASTIVYSATPENVKMTWVDGVCLYNAPKVKTIDALKLRKKIKTSQASIIRTLRRTTTRTTNAT